MLVEDDEDQFEVSSDVLLKAGFRLHAFRAVEPALAFLRTTSDRIDQGIEDLIDLFVLDRRLPARVGESSLDELGDGLLSQVRADWPDARLVVFTGYATVSHLQVTLQGGGQLPCRSGQPLDRIKVLTKDQSLEFRNEARAYRSLLQELEDVEIRVEPAGSLDPRASRMLRRLAFEYGATSVGATPLGGGLTGAQVWRCELSGAQGLLATIVAKKVKRPSLPSGLAELLPLGSAASTVASISGLLGGGYVNVIRVAGTNPTDLMTTLASDPVRALLLIQPLRHALGQIASSQLRQSVSEICESLIGWSELATILGRHSVETPSGTLSATVEVGLRHGDLHPANLMIDGTNAVLIDHDSNTFAARVIDPVTLLISTLVHPDSPIRGGDWPSSEEIRSSFMTPAFASRHSHQAWFSGVLEWVIDAKASDRELWALVLAYAGRQLQYDDVLEDREVVDRLIAICETAVAGLEATNL
ncbi:hypothetical protein ASD81_13270 [Nocardioides sp. Root614]|nr:hypothetical protein ASD81_13270 [Nocardioides sp. Root614]KRA89175.1 hypothetical protein ASD84_13535 [Nocardioides sp. Root682]